MGSWWSKIRQQVMPDTIALEKKLDTYKRLDVEAATYVECVICMKTHFTGEPPYVGWKGLGLALEETIQYKNDLEKFVAWIATNPGVSSNDMADMAWQLMEDKDPFHNVQNLDLSD